MDSYDFIVGFLAVALGFSLLVWIIVGVAIIQVLKKVKATAESAQHTAENVAEFTSSLHNAGKVSMMSSLVKQAFSMAQSQAKKKKK